MVLAWWCWHGGVGVMVLAWWCWHGGVGVMVLAWWCWCDGEEKCGDSWKFCK